MDCNVM